MTRGDRARGRPWPRVTGGVRVAVLALTLGGACGESARAMPGDPVTVHVFHGDMIHFLPDDPDRYGRSGVGSLDSGRVIRRQVTLDPPAGPCRIVARVTMHPVPKDIQSVHDAWDRAASVRLAGDDHPAVEIVKLVTAYGGETDHEVDVTHLAPLLRGDCTIEAFVDTWVSPAWRVDVSLTFRPVSDRPDTVDRIIEPPLPPPDVVVPVFHHVSLDAGAFGEGPIEHVVEVPEGLERIRLYYLVSGHCTDGRGADEFEPKTNVLLVDGAEVRRYEPWRDDCRELRAMNPYGRRWSDGSWSADYSRSGWCPGDWVRPEVIDVTDALAGGGRHRVGVLIENVRPKDESGHGYWRVSGALVGWRVDPHRPPDGS